MPNPTSKLNLVINGATTQLDIHDSNAVDLTSNQTVAGNKEFTGTTTAHDLVPSATNTYNFGSSTAQWNNAYIKSLTINGVACGDILTHNASEFVNVSGNQTIGGIKTFSDIPIVVNGKTYVSKINADRANGTQAGFSVHNGFKIVCNNDSQAWENTVFALHVPEYSPTTATVAFKLYDCIEGGASYKGFLFKKDGNGFQFSPTSSNSTDLGTSANKWKSFNGINPGALSLPSTLTNAMIQIDTTSWVLDGEADIEYTPLGNGYLTLAGGPSFEWAKGQIINDSIFGIYRFTYKYDSDLDGMQGVTIPCIKGKKVIMKIKGTGFYNAIFTYCQGNV